MAEAAGGHSTPSEMAVVVLQCVLRRMESTGGGAKSQVGSNCFPAGVFTNVD
jgi:hypothetical protein